MVAKQKEQEMDAKTHRRILRFLNAARRPEELLQLPENRFEPLLDPEHRYRAPEQKFRQKRPGPELLDRQDAERLIQERDRRWPLHGFRHIDDLGHILDDALLDRIRELLAEWFGRRNHGDWSAPEQLDPDDEHFSVVHAAVVKTGDVLFIEHSCHAGTSRTPLWNPATRSLKSSEPTSPSDGLYCSGHSFLSDGGLLVVGGRGDAYHHAGNKNTAWIYDPDAEQWDYTRDKTSPADPKPRTYMNESRWYPTLVTLGDEPGRVLIASGDVDTLTCNPATVTDDAMKMEIYSESTGKFEYVTTPDDKYFYPTYPGLHPLPGGEIFYAPVGFRTSGESLGACAANEDSAYLDLTGIFSGVWTDLGPNDRTKGMSVLLLSDTYPYVRVLTVGGGDTNTAKTYQMINLSTLTPTWDAPVALPIESGETQVKPMIHPNLVLLPDGRVFVAGGTEAGAACWIFDPDAHTWHEMDAMTYERRYHSVAVLLPTGEVLATGGKHHQAGVETFEVFQPDRKSVV